MTTDTPSAGTPRTDAILQSAIDSGWLTRTASYDAAIEHSRQLERESVAQSTRIAALELNQVDFQWDQLQGRIVELERDLYAMTKDRNRWLADASEQNISAGRLTVKLEIIEIQTIERCAKICDEQELWPLRDQVSKACLRVCAAGIRALAPHTGDEQEAAP